MNISWNLYVCYRMLKLNPQKVLEVYFYVFRPLVAECECEIQQSRLALQYLFIIRFRYLHSLSPVV